MSLLITSRANSYKLQVVTKDSATMKITQEEVVPIKGNHTEISVGQVDDSSRT